MNLSDPPAGILAGEGAPGDAAQARQFVTFDVAGEMFAVPMAPVQEIIRVPAVARLPLAPPALVGLANLRGRVLPIVDLRRLFQLDTRVHDDATRALVIDLGQPLGFVVDHVASVVSVEASAIEPATAIQSVVHADYLSGVIQHEAPGGRRRLLLLLDFEKLVQAQFAHLAQRAAEGAGAVALQRGAANDDAGGDATAASDELRLVSFTVAGQEYALAITDVQEIVQVPAAIARLPNTPPHVLGLISLRQRLLPLVSLRALFALPATEVDEQHRIVVVALPGGAQVGLVTDTVKEVLSVPRAQADIVPPALTHGDQLQEFESICRLEDGKRLVSLIAADKLLGLQGVRQAIAVAAATSGAEDGRTPADADGAPAADGAGPATDDDAQVVIFRLGAEEFGVPIMSVQEIVRVPEVLTRVPRTPAWVEGVINLRGTVLPVVDQRARLGLALLERQEGQRIMVYTLNGRRTGFIVDSVAEVLRIPRSQIAPAPALSEAQRRLITQVARLDGDKRLVMLIAPEHLLGARESRELDDIDDAAATAGDAAARAAA